MKILVCPLSRVLDLVDEHRPDRVISLLDPEWRFPELGTAYAGRHLRLTLHDVHTARNDEIAPSAAHALELVRFIGECHPDRTLLIHCRAGISRSTASAFVAACIRDSSAREVDLARALRRVSPLARPNLSLVRHADEAMGRKGRMVDAIIQTGRDLPWIEVDENEPFVWQLSPDGK
jgi:predicted protein tyrosine phosphatase